MYDRDQHDDWNDILNLRNALRAERRARNIMAPLALVGWVLALAALGGAV